ncbi:unnamed protein product [Boreogadus saida]
MPCCTQRRQQTEVMLCSLGFRCCMPEPPPPPQVHPPDSPPSPWIEGSPPPVGDQPTALTSVPSAFTQRQIGFTNSLISCQVAGKFFMHGRRWGCICVCLWQRE